MGTAAECYCLQRTTWSPLRCIQSGDRRPGFRADGPHGNNEESMAKFVSTPRLLAGSTTLIAAAVFVAGATAQTSNVPARFFLEPDRVAGPQRRRVPRRPRLARSRSPAIRRIPIVSNAEANRTGKQPELPHRGSDQPQHQAVGEGHHEEGQRRGPWRQDRLHAGPILQAVGRSLFHAVGRPVLSSSRRPRRS